MSVQKGPTSSRRIQVLWGIALSLLITAGLFCWLVVVPVCRVRPLLEIYKEHAGLTCCLLDDQELREHGGPKVLAGRLALYLSVPDAFAPHKRTAVALMASCGTHSVSSLVRVFEGDNREMREMAAWSLSTMGSDAREAVPSLVAALERGFTLTDYQTEMYAVDALAAIGPDAREAVPILVREFCADKGPAAEKSVRALGAIGPDAAPAVAPLTKYYVNMDTPADVWGIWLAILEALPKMGPRGKSVASILKVMESITPELRLSPGRTVAPSFGHDKALSCVKELGGKDRAAVRLGDFLRMPIWSQRNTPPPPAHMPCWGKAIVVLWVCDEASITELSQLLSSRHRGIRQSALYLLHDLARKHPKAKLEMDHARKSKFDDIRAAAGKRDITPPHGCPLLRRFSGTPRE